MDGTTFAPGKVNGAFSFDGNDHVTVPHNDNLNVQMFSISLWFNTAQEPSFFAELVGKSNSLYGYDGPYEVFLFNEPDAGTVVGRAAGGSPTASVDVITPGGQNDGSWHHIALTFDGSTLKLYLDGALVDSAAVNFPLITNTNPLVFGQWPWSGYTGRFYQGLMDEIQIYDRALTAEESHAIFEAGSAGKCRSIGGIAEPVEPSALPLETPGSSGPGAGLLAGVAAAVVAGTIALGGGAWYARRRRLG